MGTFTYSVELSQTVMQIFLPKGSAQQLNDWWCRVEVREKISSVPNSFKKNNNCIQKYKNSPLNIRIIQTLSIRTTQCKLTNSTVCFYRVAEIGKIISFLFQWYVTEKRLPPTLSRTPGTYSELQDWLHIRSGLQIYSNAATVAYNYIFLLTVKYLYISGKNFTKPTYHK